MEVDVEAVRSRIKEIIAQVTGIPVEEIGDETALVEDLDLDSLSLMEIGVDVDYEYRLGLGDDALQGIRSVADAVTLVRDTLAARAVA
jgi:acyl carrier protein